MPSNQVFHTLAATCLNKGVLSMLFHDGRFARIICSSTIPSTACHQPTFSQSLLESIYFKSGNFTRNFLQQRLHHQVRLLLLESETALRNTSSETIQLPFSEFSLVTSKEFLTLTGVSNNVFVPKPECFPQELPSTFGIESDIFEFVSGTALQRYSFFHRKIETSLRTASSENFHRLSSDIFELIGGTVLRSS